MADASCKHAFIGLAANHMLLVLSVICPLQTLQRLRQLTIVSMYTCAQLAAMTLWVVASVLPFELMSILLSTHAHMVPQCLCLVCMQAEQQLPKPAVPLIVGSFRALHPVQLGSLLGHLMSLFIQAVKHLAISEASCQQHPSNRYTMVDRELMPGGHQTLQASDTVTWAFVVVCPF